MNDHIAKPVDPEDLFEALARWLEHSGLEQTLPVVSEITAYSAPPTRLEPPRSYLIDYATLMQRFDGREEFIAKLMRSALDFYKEVPQQLEQMIVQSDFAGIERISHSLKSTGGNLMAQELSALAQQTNIAARQGNATSLETADALHYMLIDLLAECSQWLEIYSQKTDLK